jgi:hypothetical protein
MPVSAKSLRSKGERVVMLTAPRSRSASWYGSSDLVTSRLATMSEGSVSRSTARVVGSTEGIWMPSTEMADHSLGAPRTLM